MNHTPLRSPAPAWGVTCRDCGQRLRLLDDQVWASQETGADCPGGYRTKTGQILTAADIDALATEAEHGYDLTRLRSRVLPRDPDRLAVARAVAAYEIGDPTWADVIIAAYQDPAGARQVYPEAFAKD